jgi:hypothetical protein
MGVKRATSPKRAHASDRRLVAFHEAGHAIVAALEFGVIPERVRIWPMEGGGWKGTVDFLPNTFESLSAETRRVIGIAGAAGAMMYLKTPFFRADLVSREDWKLIGPVVGLPLALKKATAILQRERNLMLEFSRRLIIESR